MNWLKRWPARPEAAWALLAILAAYPIVMPNQYWLRVLINVGLYVILALGLNVTVGFCGLLDLGFIAFYGIGAYTYALLITKLPAVGSFWLAAPAAMAIAGGVGALVALPTMRLRGDYLAIVTVGFAEIVRLTFTNLTALTGGSKGIADIPPPMVPGTRLSFLLDSRFYAAHPFYYLVLACILLTWWSVGRLERSALGRSWKAIREDELAAAGMGIQVLRGKLLAYSCGAAYGGLAGCLMAAFNGFVAPKSFVFFESCLVLCMIVLGGIGTRAGAVLGAVVLGLLPELLRVAPEWVPLLERINLAESRYLLFGAIMVVIVILRPRGLIGRRNVEIS